MNKKIIVDYRIYPESAKKLSEKGYDIIKLHVDGVCDEPVSSHPDMYMSKIDDCLFIETHVNDMFTFSGKKQLCNREVPGHEILQYPEDITFNCVQVGKFIICNREHTHENLIKYALSNNLKIIDTKQGYAKCSTCVVSDNAIITEDENIEKVCVNAGIDVLKITKGHVKLQGYSYGFIGGCSGLIEKDVLVFNGNVALHPQANLINDFCCKYNVRVESLSKLPLYDIGSIIRI